MRLGLLGPANGPAAFNQPGPYVLPQSGVVTCVRAGENITFYCKTDLKNSELSTRPCWNRVSLGSTGAALKGLRRVGNRGCWIINGLCWSAEFVSERDLSVRVLRRSIKIPLG